MVQPYNGILFINKRNALIRRHRVSEYSGKTRPVYLLPTRLTSDLKTHTSSESEDGKMYFTQVEIKKKTRTTILTPEKIL